MLSFQATGALPHTAFIAFPRPTLCSHQQVAGLNPHVVMGTRQQAVAGLFNPPQRNRFSGAKTNVVYAVLSTSAPRLVSSDAAFDRFRSAHHEAPCHSYSESFCQLLGQNGIIRSTLSSQISPLFIYRQKKIYVAFE